MGDIWNLFLQKCLLSSLLSFKWLFSQSLNLIGYQDDKRVNFRKIFCCGHYENMPMQYTAIFHGTENDNFQLIFFTIFIFLLKTYIVGTR